MKKQAFLLLALLFSLAVFGQKPNIAITKELKTTAVKNQAMSSTCWSFATVSFVESELLRMGKGEYNLSVMYYIRKAYPIKAYNYYHFQGNSNFGPGGQAHDILNLFKQYGAMPNDAYNGLLDSKNYNLMEMDNVLGHIMKSYVKQLPQQVSEKWKTAIDSTMDVYMGKMPETFDYKGKNYTPQGFADMLGFNPDNYIEITSYAYHPWYKPYVLEVPDNWMFAPYYNLPIDELMAVIENSLNNGYTVCWDGDVSDDVSFVHNGGVAKLDNEKTKISETERQKAFEDFTVTDDHLMHLCGLAKGDDDVSYYLTKNSWGDKKGNKGFWFLSDNYVRLKTIAILVNKDAIPAHIKTKLGL
ncbi:MAG: C1 family peptidase [Bacteroidota bacterium]